MKKMSWLLLALLLSLGFPSVGTANYTSNLVNQYTLVNVLVPAYDADGNMTSYNGWSFTWNGENRLIVAENTAAGIRVEADYDYMGRRIFKQNNTIYDDACWGT